MPSWAGLTLGNLVAAAHGSVVAERISEEPIQHGQRDLVVAYLVIGAGHAADTTIRESCRQRLMQMPWLDLAPISRVAVMLARVSPKPPGPAPWLGIGILHRLAASGLAMPLLEDGHVLQEVCTDPSERSFIELLATVESASARATAAAATASKMHGIDPDRAATMRALTAILWLEQAVLSRYLPERNRDPDSVHAPWRLIGSPSLSEPVHQLYRWALGMEQKAPIAIPRASIGLGSLIGLHPVRLALAQARLDEAERLLGELDDIQRVAPAAMVLALRLALQRGDGPGIGKAITALSETGEAFGARSRIEFELRMGEEIQAVDVLSMIGRMPPTLRAASSDPAARMLPEPATRLLGGGKAMALVRRELERFAASELPVLVLGATGTGKELAARAIHDASARSGRPLISVNCAAIAEGVLESELFGHARGAFSGSAGTRTGLIAAAAGGTLFLDEIGDISPRFQAVLLRLLENGEYRPVGDDGIRIATCRFIAATNADLHGLAAAGRFRHDLLHRLLRLVVRMPTLDERREDVPELARFFLRRIAPDADLDESAIAYLSSRQWPGNVRQLRNAVESAMAGFSGISRLQADMLRDSTSDTAEQGFAREIDDDGGTAGRLANLREAFRRKVRMTRVEVASSLGVAPMTATAYLKRLCADGVVRKVMPTPAPRTHYFEWIG